MDPLMHSTLDFCHQQTRPEAAPPNSIQFHALNAYCRDHLETVAVTSEKIGLRWPFHNSCALQFLYANSGEYARRLLLVKQAFFDKESHTAERALLEQVRNRFAKTWLFSHYSALPHIRFLRLECQENLLKPNICISNANAPTNRNFHFNISAPAL